MRTYFYLILICISFFMISCSSKYKIIEDSMNRNNISISQKEKEKVNFIYENKISYWKKYPNQFDIFIKHNFTVEAKYLRSKFVGKNIEDVKNKLVYQELYTSNKNSFDLYEFKDEKVIYTFFVNNNIVQDVYIFDLI